MFSIVAMVLLVVLVLGSSLLTGIFTYTRLSNYVKGEVNAYTAEWQEIRTQSEHAAVNAMRVLNTSNRIAQMTQDKIESLKEVQTLPTPGPVVTARPSSPVVTERVVEVSDDEDDGDDEDYVSESDVEDVFVGDVLDVYSEHQDSDASSSASDTESDEEETVPEVKETAISTTTAAPIKSTELEEGEIVEMSDVSCSDEEESTEDDDDEDVDEDGDAAPVIEKDHVPGEVPTSYFLRKLSIEELRAFVVARHPETDVQKLKRPELQRLARA